MVIWLYLICISSWHRYYWFLAKHHHLVTEKKHLVMEIIFNVTITNYSLKKKEKKMVVA
jgi:hypothetical protein